MSEMKRLSCCLLIQRASLIAQFVKNPPAMQETPVRFLGWEDALEEGFLQTAGSQKSEFEGYPLIPDDTFLSKATCAGTNAAGGACLACPYVRIGILLASSSRSAWDSWLTLSLSPPIPTVGRRTTA